MNIFIHENFPIYGMWYHVPTSIVLNVGRKEHYKFGDHLQSGKFVYPENSDTLKYFMSN